MTKVHITYTIKGLAELTGFSRQTISRDLKSLKLAGLDQRSVYEWLTTKRPLTVEGK